MQLNRCPICRNRITLAQLVQDEAGRELLGVLVKLDVIEGSALVGYLGLFRSEQRDLSLDKALKLTKEVQALGNKLVVTQAMRQTVDNLLGKLTKPLSNHNYVKRIIESGVMIEPERIAQPKQLQPVGQTVGAMAELQRIINGEQ